MAPTGPAYHVDWVFSNTSNVHVANHSDWFTTFTDFETHTTVGLVVAGIGDVELDVKTHVSRKGSKSHRKIVLRNVLFAPNSTCNILGSPIFEEYGLEMNYGSKTGGLKDMRTGGNAGLFDYCKLPKLWLVGQQKGKSSLDPNLMHWINAQWSEAERARFEAYKKSLEESAKPTKQSESGVAPYTPEEKKWLKREFGGEYKFLRSYGLSIYKEDDRAEGRSIARAMIEQEVAEGDANDEEGEEQNDFLADLEADPTSHFADRFFSEAQLDWIEKHYRHSGNFLLSYGLKFYDDEDCKEGVAIVRAIMRG